MTDIPGIDLLPAELRGWAILAMMIAPYVGRAYHAIVSGGGLVGIWRAIMLGTNTPKK